MSLTPNSILTAADTALALPYPALARQIEVAGGVIAPSAMLEP